jgi:phosphoribosylglycinamide formyltransferase-1
MAAETRLGILVSGTGSILEALLRSDLPIVVVVADRPCRALEVARVAGISTELVDRRRFGGFSASFDRSRYTRELVQVLCEHRVDLLAMAGFGTVVSKELHDAYPERILNTHPSLLPAFPGWRAVEEALEAKVDVTGCTVHVATLETDAGPIVAQEEVAVRPGDSVDELHERIKKVERELYPEAIRAYMSQLERSVLERDVPAARGARR